jgi:ornithine cyclodeaminase
MKFIDREQVEALLDMKSCIVLMRKALIDLAEGNAKQALRMAMPLGGGNFLGLMPSSMASKNIAGVKIITIFPGNFQKGLPSHQGMVLVVETLTGSLKAMVDGEAITGIRTAAVSAVATDFLARKNVQSLAVIGSGLQARKHLEAVRLVRDIKMVFVWDIDAASAKRYADEMAGKFSLPVEVCGTSGEAARNADIICTVTAAREPVLFAKDIKSGAHINAVGACRPDARELDTETIVKGKLYADRMEAILNEAGDFLIPLSEGAVSKEKISGELGDALLGKINGRQGDDEITIFESLGLGVYDLAAADYLVNL